MTGRKGMTLPTNPGEGERAHVDAENKHSLRLKCHEGGSGCRAVLLSLAAITEDECRSHPLQVLREHDGPHLVAQVWAPFDKGGPLVYRHTGHPKRDLGAVGERLCWIAEDVIIEVTCHRGHRNRLAVAGLRMAGRDARLSVTTRSR